MYNNMHSIYYYISACVRNALNAIEQLVHSTPAPVNTLFEKVFIRGFLCIKVLLTHTCTRHGWLFHMWVLHVIFLTFFVGPPPTVTFHLILSRVPPPPACTTCVFILLHIIHVTSRVFTWVHVCDFPVSHVEMRSYFWSDPILYEIKTIWETLNDFKLVGFVP